MAAGASVSLMVMYEDESVDVRYGSGAQLQLSPCGREFLLERAAEPAGHPLRPRERVRQRTRFTVSSYKELMVAALAFRNQYASRPYLPEELIPAERRKPFFSIDTRVQWPEWSSCEADLGPRGETVVRSEEGRAVLTLSPSGEEFSVEFTCSLSQTQHQNQHHAAPRLSRDPDSNRQQGGSKELLRSRSCSPRIISSSQPEPGQVHQSTVVVQHHSCCACAPTWRYPLSLARRHQATRLSKAEAGAEGAGDPAPADGEINTSDTSSEERSSHLPQALPHTCPSPHRHRWKTKDPLADKEQSDQDLPTELVKVMWCQGVTYRILSGAVSIVEVSPGDGSVIRSNGVLKTYFTHHLPELQSGHVKEVSYHLSSLPPDVLRQVYSVRSVVSRASRILSCYDQAKQSLRLPATPSCLQEAQQGRYLSKPPLLEEHLSNPAPVQHHMTVSHPVESRSDLVAAELEKIKRFNFLLENSHLRRGEGGCVEPQSCSVEEEAHEPVRESSIAEALQRTSKAIRDIDTLMSATTLT